MILNLSGEIDQALFDKLVDALNLLEDKKLLTVYFNSSGGSVDWMEAIIDVINQNQEKMQLIAFGEINSAAFDIFFRSKCDREILPETIGICHFSGAKVHMIDNKTPRNATSRSWVQWSEMFLESCVQFCKALGFTDNEINRMKKGEDLFFHTKRLIEFLNNSNIGKHNEYIQ